MEAGIVAQPAPGLAVAPLVRPIAAAAQGAAPTDLPQAKAVNQLPQAAPAHNDPPPVNPSVADIAHNFVVDLQTQDVIFRVMDLRTRQVLFQLPDAALLRQVAYERALAANGKSLLTTTTTNITS